MKILSGIFSLSGFLGVLAAGFFLPQGKAPVNLAPKVSPKQTAANEDSTAEYLVDYQAAVAEGDWEKAAAELKKDEVAKAVDSETALNLKALTELKNQIKVQQSATNGKFDDISATAEKSSKAFMGAIGELKASIEKLAGNQTQHSNNNDQVLSQLDQISERLTELEKRAIQPVAPEPVTPEQPTSNPEPVPETETEEESVSLPTPSAINVSFGIGSLNFSDEASKRIETAANKMKADPLLVANIRGSATGFSTGLGKSRADAVRAKFGEFGISNDRISVSNEGSSGSDAASITFRKKTTRATTDS